MALLLVRQDNGGQALSASENALYSVSVESKKFKITLPRLKEKEDDALSFQQVVLQGLPNTEIRSILEYFFSSEMGPNVDKIRKLLRENGFEDQSNLQPKSDVKDFALGLCIRMAFCVGQPSMILGETFDSSKLVRDTRNRLGLTPSTKEYKKISRSRIESDFQKWEIQALLKQHGVTAQGFTSKADLCNLLYALLWIDPSNPHMDHDVEMSTQMQSVESHELIELKAPANSTNSSDPHIGDTGGEKDSRRTKHTNSNRCIGNAEPHKCPALLQISQRVCEKPIGQGPYCNIHAKVFPQLKSAEPRLLKHVYSGLKDILNVHGYGDLMNDAGLIDTLKKLLKMARENQEPWDNLSSTLLPHRHDLADDTPDDDITAEEYCDETALMLLSANVDGNHRKPSEFQKSCHIRQLMIHYKPKIVMLQEILLKNLVKKMEEGKFLDEGNRFRLSILLSKYTVVKVSDKPDTCMLYNKTFFESQGVAVDLTEFFEEKYVKKRPLRSGFRGVGPLHNRYAGIKLKVTATGHKFLCLSFHGIRALEKARNESFDTPLESTKAFLKAVIGYVRENQIPALIGGDFNLKKNILESICLSLMADPDALQLSEHSRDDGGIIDYFVLIHPPHGGQKDPKTLIFDDNDQTRKPPEYDDTLFNHEPVVATLRLV